MKKISLVIPCYNEQESLPLFDAEMDKVIKSMSEYSFEIIYVNDGSKDNTLKCIKELYKKRTYVRFISFSRNFGKEAAMYAGFKNVTGDFVAIMDADLQDPPSLLPDMIRIMESGEYDSVATRRVSRDGEPPIRSFFARMFYKIINKISDADIVDGARDYRLMKREMVNVIVEMGERNRFSKGIFGWIGYKTYWYEYKNVERIAGETKWSFWKLFKYSIEGIVSFSQVPLSISSWLGMICTGVAFLAIIFIIIRKIIMGDPVQGWASTICLIMFIGGIQLFCMGIMGQYIGKTYVESKGRPHYIASEGSDEDIIKVG
ncbi:glycosyltransferase family 2 protein [Dorea formicigenerans]|uniref:Glycosyltransferase n=1 Tax=Dorea formicigenerans TaxID=39486 RepID=A0A413SSA3_9FIRM|nr:glycosyltransferase family 2 protein [Dorea formicigenerans]RHA71155.1 glycosyltransferase [Dorea formicigenerans]